MQYGDMICGAVIFFLGAVLGFGFGVWIGRRIK